MNNSKLVKVVNVKEKKEVFEVGNAFRTEYTITKTTKYFLGNDIKFIVNKSITYYYYNNELIQTLVFNGLLNCSTDNITNHLNKY